MFFPAAMAPLQALRSSSTASRSAGAPPLMGHSMGMVIEWKPWEWPLPSSWRSRSSSSLRSTGLASVIWRADSGVGSSRFPSGPIEVSTAMTISSRMASTGGFVTWANSCLK